ncbi:MAG: hypothetical protein K2M96_03985 [Prevotella sp.]|nr:hypothetical protein [Prevotella sp.]
MKTTNIRCATLVVATALSLTVSAQKNVLKAFEKFRTSKGVTVTGSTCESEKSPMAWRCNIVEFKVAGGAGTAPAWQAAKMEALQRAFEKDSHDKTVTYFSQMEALGEKATEEEKARYKKTTVRYNATADPIVLGANTSNNVVVLRCKSKHSIYRTVVALEWRQDEQNGCVGTFYEIEGHNDLVRANTVSAADDEKGGDNIIARMNFYHDNYTGEETTANKALLLNMLEYLSSDATYATEREKGIAETVLRVMAAATTSKIQQGIMEQCMQGLRHLKAAAPTGSASRNEIMARLELYYQEWKSERVYASQKQVRQRLTEYLLKHKLDADTFAVVHKGLLKWCNEMIVYAEKDEMHKLIAELERRYDNGQVRQ